MSGEENFKDKEQRLEQNFSRLLDRYNKSKTLIDNLYVNVHHQERSHQHQQQPQSQSQKFPITKTQRSRPKYDEEKENVQLRNNSIENLNKLKETLTLKQTLDVSRKDRMKLINKELKSQLHQAEDHIKSLEQKLKQRDLAIRQRDEELAALQDSSAKQQHTHKEFKMKDEGNQNFISEIKESVQQLKTKVDRKKQKIKSLKAQLLFTTDKQDSQAVRYSQELEHLQRLCDQFSNEIRESEQSKSFLSSELNKLQEHSQLRDDKYSFQEKQHQDVKLREQELAIRLEQEVEKRREVQQKYDQSVRALEDTRETLFITDAKVTKMKSRSDDERALITKEFESMFEVKKEKILKLKLIIADHETQLTLKSKDQDNQQRLYSGVLADMDKQILQMNDLRAQLDNKNQQKQDLMKEFQSLDEQLTQQNKLITQYQGAMQDTEHHRSNDLHQQHEQEDYINEQQNKIQNLYKYIKDLEDQLQSSKIGHLEEMDGIEIKIEQVLNEMNHLKQENVTLKHADQSHKKQLTQCNDALEVLQQKHTKLKEKHEQLQNKSKYTEDKLKQQDTERAFQQKEMMTKLNQTQSNGEVTKNKIKALDEIQGMISLFKQR